MSFSGDRLQYFVAVDFPDGEKMKVKGSSRDVYLHRGNVDLTQFNYTHGRVDDTKQLMEICDGQQ
jgi:hypothetical protein